MDCRPLSFMFQIEIIHPPFDNYLKFHSHKYNKEYIEIMLGSKSFVTIKPYGVISISACEENKSGST